LFSTPEALANIAGIQVPILIIAALSGTEAGYLFLAMQIMAAPMTLIGASIGQVYVSRAPEQLKNGTLWPFTKNMMIKQFLIGAGPIAAIGITAPIVFPFILGDEWVRSGEIAAVSIPWMIFQFVASPVSTVMFLVNRHAQLLAIRIATVIFKVAFIMVAGQLGFGIVTAFAISNALVYGALILVFALAAHATKLGDTHG